ncbi:MAG TPA: hypothetical protein VL333_07825 [Candidatus Saccharimonadales bacterium]|jgi:hypothetical protein|nr:hypothetical protein [Candidatus Saccharimonadales bacterium]
MSPTLRASVAAFDAVAMSVFAYLQTGGFGNPGIDLMLWGSAAAAAVAAFVVATNGPGLLGWIAIGYILFAGILLTDAPQLLLIALAIALMPVVQRPRNSLAIGVVVATLSAFVWRIAIELLLRSAA